MGQQRQGSAKLPPGKWSLAVASAIDPMVEDRDGRRDAFARDAGISRGRIVRLLDGDSPWYLEDVERACKVLNLDVIEFLDGLDVPVDIASRRGRVSPAAEDEVAANAAAEGEIGVDTEHSGR